MRNILILSVLLYLPGIAHSKILHCTFVEIALDYKATCIFIGNRGEETKQVVITPDKKIGVAQAAKLLFVATGAFDMSEYHPEFIQVLTDE